MDDFMRREEEYKVQISNLKKEKEDVNNQNLQIQKEWQKLQMQPNELEMVERKYAELEFGIRQKEVKIRQTKNYIQIIDKLNIGKEVAPTGEANPNDDCCLDLIDLKDDIEKLRKILKEEELVNQQLEQVQQRLDNYYGLPGQLGTQECSSEFEEKIYSNMIDDSTKILITTQ